MIDRISPRQRPAGCAVLHQRWSALLFLHWRCDPGTLRPLLPAGLELDVFDGETWVGLTPFTVSRMRPSLLPPLPGLSCMHEINLRVYVHRDGVPGIWFPSLDADHLLAVWGARIAYRLPYHLARMTVAHHRDGTSFRSERAPRDGAPATFDAAWSTGDRVPDAVPGSLDFFLLERYVLYCGTANRLMRARIHHRPWPLRGATLARLQTSLLAAQGISPLSETPLVHAQAEPFDIAVWPPSRA